SVILDLRRDGSQQQFWELAFGKRPSEELFAIDDDQECMTNLAETPEYQKVKQALKQQLEAELKAQQDPRMTGKGGVFEAYQYSDPRTRNFYERYMGGEPLKAGWVNKTDFEAAPLD
ncbi:MAG: heparan N-sulfatase, partial [Gimesia chilikensis]